MIVTVRVGGAGRYEASSGPPTPWTRAKTSVKLRVPNVVQIIITPRPKPKSPIRLTMNAFLAAPAAEGFLYQKPISA